MTRPRILLYDIETTDLELDFGNMVAFGYAYFGHPQVKVLSLLDFADPCASCGLVDAVSDAKLVRAAWAILGGADMWVTWYGKQFDIKALNTRALDAKLKPLPPIPHIDLYWTARNNLRLSSNRLANVQDFLRLPTSKTPLTKRVWRQAQAGHVPSLRYIIRHCRRDVACLGEAYSILRPWVRQHPRVGDRGACRVCGSPALHRHGTRVTVTQGAQIRLACQACGHIEQRPMRKDDG